MGVSWGVGCSLTYEGKLYRSEHKFNHEIGHVCIDINGPVCNCGRKGCLETYISTLRLEERLKKETGENLSFKEFCLKYKDSGPEGFERVFHDATDKFSVALTNSVNYTGIENYILGHDGCCIPDRFVEECIAKVNDRIMFRGHRKIKLIKSKIHGEEFSSTCACAILERIFMGDINSIS